MAEMPEADAGGSRRKRRDNANGASNVTAEREEGDPGWSNYFRHAQVKATFERLDEWTRRRLRCVQWRQWKRHNDEQKRQGRQGERG